MTVESFWRSTLGEIAVTIIAYKKRQRDEIAGQVIAVTRALAASFGSSGDPLEGLRDGQTPVQISPAEAKWKRFWS